jgi:hypothetical protein
MQGGILSIFGKHREIFIENCDKLPSANGKIREEWFVADSD